MDSDELGFAALTKIGYDVVRIPESHKQEADFIVKHHQHVALVESKLRQDDKGKLEAKDKALNAGEVFVDEAVLGRNDAMARIIRKAARQLESSSNLDHHFRMVLMFASGMNARTKRDQIIDTLYGSTQLIEVGAEKPTLIKCYFFRSSDFFRWRAVIDAAIVGLVTEDGGVHLQACINPYSERHPLLISSSFLMPFGNAVIDPVEEEKSGEAFIPDPDVERAPPGRVVLPQETPMLAHLSTKYNKGQLLCLDFDSSEYSIRIS